MRKFLWVGLLFGATACTDGAAARLAAIGDAGDVTCYSGGTVIYKGRSTGKIAAEEQSDGWYFKDAATGKLVRLSGDCVITN